MSNPPMRGCPSTAAWIDMVMCENSLLYSGRVVLVWKRKQSLHFSSPTFHRLSPIFKPLCMRAGEMPGGQCGEETQEAGRRVWCRRTCSIACTLLRRAHTALSISSHVAALIPPVGVAGDRAGLAMATSSYYYHVRILPFSRYHFRLVPHPLLFTDATLFYTTMIVH